MNAIHRNTNCFARLQNKVVHADKGHKYAIISACYSLSVSVVRELECGCARRKRPGSLSRFLITLRTVDPEAVSIALQIPLEFRY